MHASALCGLVLLIGGDVHGLVALSRSPHVVRRCGPPLLRQEPADRASDAVKSVGKDTLLNLEGKVVPLGQGKVVPAEEDCMYTACPVPAEDDATGEASFSYVAFAQVDSRLVASNHH